MKICWDNLEKLTYTKHGNFKDRIRNITYYYKDFCKNCGEPFLSSKKIGETCSVFCGTQGINKGNKRHDLSQYNKKHIRIGCNNPNWKGGYHTNNIPLYDTYASQINFCEPVRRNKQDSNILEVKCAYCGKWFIPLLSGIQSRSRALNGKFTLGTEHRLYCSKNCKQECPIYNKIKYQVGHPKSDKKQYAREVQPQLRQLVFERDNYTCQKCDKTQDELETGLHCHHLTGVEINPIESADIDNCITLCKNCHEGAHRLPGCGYQDFKRKKCEE